MFLIIVFFSYMLHMLSLVKLLLFVFIRSYSSYPKVHWIGGIDHVDVVSGWDISANTPYMPGRGVDRGGDSTVESFVVLPPYVSLVELMVRVVSWVLSSSFYVEVPPYGYG